MALQLDQIDDFVAATQPYFKRYKWVDLSLEHQEYVSSSLIDKQRVQEEGGPTIKFQIQVKNTGNARTSGLYDVDQTKVEDVLQTGTVDWKMTTTNYSYDINEDFFQSDRETIIKILKLREHDALNSLAELQEIHFWSAPSSTTAPEPYGVPFWLQAESSASTGAFAGGNPSTHSSGCASVSSTTYPRWRNWTFTYTQPTIDDLIQKIKKSLAFTYFQPPVAYPELGYGKPNHEMFTTYRVVEPLERVAETRNDNLGADLARYRGQVTIGGVPIRWVPYLEANDTTDPIYGVNWKVFRPYSKKGAAMRRTPPFRAARQRNVREVHIDNTMNFCCVNRRLCFRGTK